MPVTYRLGGVPNCGLTAEGAAYYSGYNADGWIGDGTVTDWHAPERCTMRSMPYRADHRGSYVSVS
jgi:hypothetical protein